MAEDTLGKCEISINGQGYIWIVDPDDLIFPRAATRVGPKYQAVIPSLSAMVSSSVSDDALPPQSVVDGDQRGGDNTVEVQSLINSLTDEEGAHIYLTHCEVIPTDCDPAAERKWLGICICRAH